MDLDISLTFIAVLAGLVQPFFTAVASKSDSGDLVKGVLSVLFAAFVAVARPVLGEGDLPADWTMFAGDFLETYVVGLLSWLGLSSDWTRRLNELTGGYGFSLPTSGD